MRNNTFFIKKSCLLFLFGVLHLTMTSQSPKDTIESGTTQGEKPHLSISNVLKLNFLLPGISYEKKIGNYQTLNVGVYMDGIFTDRIESIDRRSHLLLTPTFNVEFRNYYNLNKRIAKGKNTAFNSANYLAALYRGRLSRTSYYSERIFVNQLGAVWGMQRNYPKGFSLDLNGGLAYTFNAKDYYYYDAIELVLQAKIGFWLGNRNR